MQDINATIKLRQCDVNLELVRVGLAWHYKQYQREQSPDDRSAYAQAEERAKAEKQGLWIDSDPTPPWDWRHQRKPKRGR